MNERLNKILAYEKDLIEYRHRLIELERESAVSEGKDRELVQYKLDCFKKEIAFMNHQIEIMKSFEGTQRVMAAQGDLAVGQQSVVSQESVAKQEPVVSRESVAGQQPAMVQQAVAQQAEMVMQSTPAQDRGTVYSSQNTAEQRNVAGNHKSATQTKDLEKTIGKVLMGVFASVLIFISLILFATLLLPYFNDTAKMITTYVISFAFLTVGLLKLRKDKENKFYLTLTGCGIGALYISLLLSNMYFKVLGDIALYVLLCIWGILVCLFAKRQKVVFQIIGELGILIAVLFGCYFCLENEEMSKFTVLLVFYAISSAVYYIVNYKKEFDGNLVHHIFHLINMFFLAISCVSFDIEPVKNAGLWIVIAFCFISFASCMVHKLEKSSVGFGMFSSLYIVLGNLLMMDLFEQWETSGIIVYIIAIPLLVLTQLKEAKDKTGIYILQVCLILCAAGGLCDGDMWITQKLSLLLIIPLFVAGFLCKNSLFKYSALCLYVFFLIETDDSVLKFIMAVTMAILVHVLQLWKKEQYSPVFKYIMYCFTMFYLVCGTEYLFEELECSTDLQMTITYAICAGINFFMMKGPFSKNLRTKEKENPAVYNTVNLIFMIMGLAMLSEGYEMVYHLIIMLLTVAVFMVNVKNLLDNRKNFFAGIYVGIKFAVLMLVILNSFDAVSYVVSIACLLFAIVSIVIGFVGEYKALRIFGLILSMISIFKLIMIDISYQNTLGNAVSFFVSGILCFGISLIYNRIDSKVKERA